MSAHLLAWRLSPQGSFMNGLQACWMDIRTVISALMLECSNYCWLDSGSTLPNWQPTFTFHVPKQPLAIIWLIWHISVFVIRLISIFKKTQQTDFISGHLKIAGDAILWGFVFPKTFNFSVTVVPVSSLPDFVCLCGMSPVKSTAAWKESAGLFCDARLFKFCHFF